MWVLFSACLRKVRPLAPREAEKWISRDLARGATRVNFVLFPFPLGNTHLMVSLKLPYERQSLGKFLFIFVLGVTKRAILCCFSVTSYTYGCLVWVFHTRVWVSWASPGCLGMTMETTHSLRELILQKHHKHMV